MDNGEEAPTRFAAPQPQLFALITEGILSRKLEWSLVIVGALIALTMELARVSSLPFAVGMYLPLSTTTSIFAGGMVRWLADKFRGEAVSETESETSSGVLLGSGYIAGGTLVGLIVAFFVFLPKSFNEMLDVGRNLGKIYTSEDSGYPKIVALAAFVALALILFVVGSRKSTENGQDVPSEMSP